MHHEMLTQRAPFCIGACDGKKGTLSQHFVTHVVPPLSHSYSKIPMFRAIVVNVLFNIVDLQTSFFFFSRLHVHTSPHKPAHKLWKRCTTPQEG